MKQVKGNAFNIGDDILGRITKSRRNIFNRKDSILVAPNITNMPIGYEAVITNVSNLNTQKPYIGNVLSLDDFNEGDVVSINKDGEILFLYEINSTSNSVFVTGRCNHRCIMCPQPPITEEMDRTDFNLKLISLFDKSTKEVGITGGEPTIVGDRLFEIIRQIKKCLPHASISILSNGVKFADRNYAFQLAACNCKDLQIDVPLFSDIAKLHNEIVGAKTFYKTVEGLYNLALYGVKIGIRVVLHRMTYERLPQLADFIYHNFPFVTQVAFMQMETVGLAEENIEKLWIDPHDYNRELEEAVMLLSLRGITTFIYNAQLCVLPNNLREFSTKSISEWKDVYLEECYGCQLRSACGGLFESNKKYHSKYIKSI